MEKIVNAVNGHRTDRQPEDEGRAVADEVRMTCLDSQTKSIPGSCAEADDGLAQ